MDLPNGVGDGFFLAEIELSPLSNCALAVYVFKKGVATVPEGERSRNLWESSVLEFIAVELVCFCASSGLEVSRPLELSS